MPIDPLFLRAALRLHAVYQARAAQALEQMLQEQFAAFPRVLAAVRSHLRQTSATGLPSALQLRRPLHALVRVVQEAVRQLGDDRQTTLPTVPPLRGLLAELQQLEDEFGTLQVDLRRHTLRVVTEPIDLEDVLLGPFALQLDWKRLTSIADSACFKLVALEPNPASTNEEVTHPHVRNGALCAGEATVPLQRALEQGRLADAFCLVRSVLSTYNRRSPHVALEQWYGQGCYECGGGIHPEEASYCEDCGYNYCSDCLGSCRWCQESRCGDCLKRCCNCAADCCSNCCIGSVRAGKFCCRRCLKACAVCQALVPPDELTSPSQCCPACASASPATSPPGAGDAAATVPVALSELPTTESLHESITASATTE